MYTFHWLLSGFSLKWETGKKISIYFLQQSLYILKTFGFFLCFSICASLILIWSCMYCMQYHQQSLACAGYLIFELFRLPHHQPASPALQQPGRRVVTTTTYNLRAGGEVETIFLAISLRCFFPGLGKIGRMSPTIRWISCHLSLPVGCSFSKLPCNLMAFCSRGSQKWSASCCPLECVYDELRVHLSFSYCQQSSNGLWNIHL